MSSNVPSPSVAKQRVGPPAGDEQVGVAVIVDVADSDAVAVATWQRGDSRSLADVLECAIALVPEKAIAGVWCVSAGGERAPLHHVDVEPAVAVVVEQADARRSIVSGIW